jgi:hypothetical protein
MRIIDDSLTADKTFYSVLHIKLDRRIYSALTMVGLRHTDTSTQLKLWKRRKRLTVTVTRLI